jgi:hypothetical protein
VHELSTEDGQTFGGVESLCVFGQGAGVGRYRLAAMGHTGSIWVWDLGPPPAREAHLRAAGKLGDW